MPFEFPRIVRDLETGDVYILERSRWRKFGIPTSKPPAGKKRIKNIYWDPDTKEIVVETE